jgi:hypothetical protein
MWNGRQVFRRSAVGTADNEGRDRTAVCVVD